MDEWGKKQTQVFVIAGILLSLAVGGLVGAFFGVLSHSWTGFWFMGLVGFLASLDVCFRGKHG